MPYFKAFLFSPHITCWPIISRHSKAWAGLNLRMDFCLEQIYVVKQLLMFHFCRVVLFVIFLKKVIELLYHATFESSNVKWKVQHLLFPFRTASVFCPSLSTDVYRKPTSFVILQVEFHVPLILVLVVENLRLFLQRL